MDVEALGLEEPRQALFLVVGGEAVRIVAEQGGHDLVGRDRGPHVGEGVAGLVETPEEVVGPLEALLGVALAREEPSLPRIVRRNARNAGELALVGHRIDRVRRRRRGHQVDFVVVDELRRHFRRAVRVRLAVLGDDLDVILLTADRDAVGQHLLHAVDHPLGRLAESGDRAGLRGHHADLDGLAGGARRLKRPRRGDCTGAGGAQKLDDLAALRIDVLRPLLSPRCFHSGFPPWFKSCRPILDWIGALLDRLISCRCFLPAAAARTDTRLSCPIHYRSSPGYGVD